MYDACHEARVAGSSIANLNGCLLNESGNTIDKSALVRAARQLLSSVTRVLLLADRVLVKHILRAEDKVCSLFFPHFRLVFFCFQLFLWTFLLHCFMFQRLSLVRSSCKRTSNSIII